MVHLEGTGLYDNLEKYQLPTPESVSRQVLGILLSTFFIGSIQRSKQKILETLALNPRPSSLSSCLEGFFRESAEVFTLDYFKEKPQPFCDLAKVGWTTGFRVSPPPSENELRV